MDRHHTRIERLAERATKSGADAFLVTHLPNVFYICGFTGTSGALLLGPRRSTLFTDSRYAEQSSSEVSGAGVRIARKGLLPEISALLKRFGRRLRVGFEVDNLTVAQLRLLQRLTGPRVRWVPVHGAVEGLRIVKDAGEIAVMRQAAALGSALVGEVIGLIRPGLSELDLAAEVDYRMKRRGASGPAFDTIVASGRRSALPHGRPSDKVFRKNELVVLDLGAILRHYCCDITRTVYLGRAPKQVRRWYRAVLDAQTAACEVIQAGVGAGQVDRAARRVLERGGLGRYFTHSTGHGLGIEIHEAPRLAKGQTTPLLAGSVVTVEPGVYLPGRGGIRVEDDVLVLPHGCEVLTSAPREFMEI
jgi:Xaa-Pro aminopeptidase